MKQLMFILIFLSKLILILASGEEVTYCVIPTENSTCLDQGCQQCETLEYYIENIDETINKHSNVTMIFFRGHHKTCQPSVVTVTSSSMIMVGEQGDVSIQGQHSTVNFMNSIYINFESLLLKELNLKFGCNSSLGQPLVFQFISVKLYSSEVTARASPHTKANLEYIGCALQNGRISTVSANNSYRSINLTIIDSKLLNNSISAANCIINITGVSEFTNAQTSAISSYDSAIILSGTVSFRNNTATRGAAMALHDSWLYFEVGVIAIFTSNVANDKGGAIFTEPNFQPYRFNHRYMFNYCFYSMVNCSVASNYRIYFGNNSAVNGGNDIYGAPPERFCNPPCSSFIERESNEEFSSLSSDPTRVCLCNERGVPQCLVEQYIYTNWTLYPGETLSVSAVVVGGDFGPTIGTVYAGFLNERHSFLRPTSQYGQAIDKKLCSTLQYTIYSNQTNSTISLYLSQEYMDSDEVRSYIDVYYYTSVLLNITILPCPPGLTLSNNPPKCDCYKVLTDNHVTCEIKNGTGYFIWSGNMWINISDNGIIYAMYCPFDYCTLVSKIINMQHDPDSQCAFNRAGRLCGGCKDGYSLAIGSSHCIHCPNSNNLALVIFFVAAGFLLVFFIGALNLTVSQGKINGLIFYANIVWMYQHIFFPQEQSMNGLLVFLRVFIAWINLDFGIETCFVSGLNAFWKTWLQFIFPFYIWGIAGLIIVASRYSTRLTNLLGNRAVPMLDTLFLLSYMKLLRTLSAALDFFIITKYPDGTKFMVWSEDGNLTYFGFPHVLLFLAGLATLLFLWLPYTSLLLLMQCIRRVSHLKYVRQIMQFNPVYDAYFAPLKAKHQYWFGVLLLIRGILLVSTFGISPNINLLLLSIFSIVLLFYMTITQPYKSRIVLLLSGSFLTNLTLLSGCVIYASHTHSHQVMLKTLFIGLSTGLAFLQFCGIILYSIIAPRCSIIEHGNKKSDKEINAEEKLNAEINVGDYGLYRDPIFD